MNKEEAISAAVMCLVSFLMLIGFTVAWYTRLDPAVTGMQMVAGDPGSIIVALESQGEDISVLAEDEIEGNEYADMGLGELTNVENNELAPGAFGRVTFYVRPDEMDISGCDIVPMLGIQQGDDDWYFGEESGTDAKKALYAIAERHIDFYSNEEMTEEINAQNPKKLLWTEAESDAKEEKTVVVYWKWHYENPLAAAEQDEARKKEMIKEYDDEDRQLGSSITSMKFYFTFSVK